MRALVTLGVAAALSACASPLEPGDWTIAHEEPRGVLLSVWGAAADDLWVTGGQVDRGLVLHGDGTSWTEVETGADGLLWSVYGFEADDVYAIGANGLLLHYDGTAWSRIDAGTTRALYGLWGASADDVWFVGGDPWGAPGDAVVLRGSRGVFSAVVDLPASLRPASFTKVYGTSADDVVFVGTNGTLVRWNGATWRRDAVPTTDALVAVWGRAADDLYAVGGQSRGELLRFDGRSWTSIVGPSYVPGLSGIFTAPERPLFVVGANSYVLEVGLDGAAVRRDTPLDRDATLHSVWGDAAGNVYAVGGDLNRYPGAMRGVVLVRR